MIAVRWREGRPQLRSRPGEGGHAVALLGSVSLGRRHQSALGRARVASLRFPRPELGRLDWAHPLMPGCARRSTAPGLLKTDPHRHSLVPAEDRPAAGPVRFRIALAGQAPLKVTFSANATSPSGSGTSPGPSVMGATRSPPPRRRPSTCPATHDVASDGDRSGGKRGDADPGGEGRGRLFAARARGSATGRAGASGRGPASDDRHHRPAKGRPSTIRSASSSSPRRRTSTGP